MISPKKIKDIQTPVGIVCLNEEIYFYFKNIVVKGKVVGIGEDDLLLDVYFVTEDGGRTVTITAFDVLDCPPNQGVYTPKIEYAESKITNKLENNNEEDIVNPKRYTSRGTLECWDVIIDQKMSYLEGSVLKYLWRYKEKNGIHDLKKAKVYIDKIISELENNK